MFVIEGYEGVGCLMNFTCNGEYNEEGLEGSRDPNQGCVEIFRLIKPVGFMVWQPVDVKKSTEQSQCL